MASGSALPAVYSRAKLASPLGLLVSKETGSILDKPLKAGWIMGFRRPKYFQIAVVVPSALQGNPGKPRHRAGHITCDVGTTPIQLPRWSAPGIRLEFPPRYPWRLKA
jgi:hypothetical protein